MSLLRSSVVLLAVLLADHAPAQYLISKYDGLGNGTNVAALPVKTCDSPDHPSGTDCGNDSDRSGTNEFGIYQFLPSLNRGSISFIEAPPVLAAWGSAPAGTPVNAIIAPAPDDGFGSGVAVYSENGFSLVAAGSPYFDPATGAANAGRLSFRPFVAPDRTVPSEDAGAQFGGAVGGAAAAGRRSALFVVGEPVFDLNGTDRGRVCVFSAATGKQIYVIDGAASGDRFGFAVAMVGDADGDGVDDFAVGAPFVNASPSLTDAGRVYVYSGRLGTLLRSFDGGTIAENLGWSVAGAGDVDHDGYADVVAGAPGYDPNTFNSADTGRARVWSVATNAVLGTLYGAQGGDRFGTAVAKVGNVVGGLGDEFAVGAPGGQGAQPGAGYVKLFSLPGVTAFLTLGGWFTGDEFGASLGTAGDLDADGKPELMIGAPGFDHTGMSDAGQVVIHGATLPAPPMRSYFGPAGGERFGSAVTLAGDWNGDGQADFAVGSPMAAGTGGTVRILDAASTSLVVLASATGSSGERLGRSIGAADVAGLRVCIAGAPFAMAGAGRVRLLATAAMEGFDGSLGGANFGAAVAHLGDADGDHYPDFVVGAPSFGSTSAAGRVHVVSGATGAVLLTSSTLLAQNGERLGSTVAAVGDIDGDGKPEFAAGAPNYSSGLGRVRAFSGANGAVLASLQGSFPGEGLGTSLAAIGDIDGDGHAELVAGGPLATHSGLTNAGVVRVLNLLSPTPLPPIPGTRAHGRFGSAVSGVGDWNGDGVPDFAIGEPGPPPPATALAGRVRVHSGAQLSATLAEILEPAAGDRLGASLALAGDLNGDGLADLVVGSPFADSGGMTDNGAAHLVSFAGIPTGSPQYGSGSPGTAGRVPIIQAAGGLPLVSCPTGSPHFGMSLSNVLPGTTAYLAAGASNASWSSYSLPLSLTPWGAAGTTLLVEPAFLLPFTTATAAPGSGRVFLPLPLPCNPSAAQSVIHCQWFVIDPGSPNQLLASSSGLGIRFL